MARKSGADLAVVASVGQRMPPPPQLTEAQCALWEQITNSLPADFFRPGDVPLLAAYCKAWHFYLLAAGEVEANGVTVEDANGRRVANPAQGMLVTQASAMAQLSVKLRLSPSSRYSEKSAATKAGAVGVGVKPWATG